MIHASALPSPPCAEAPASTAGGWQGHLKLGFRARGTRTVLTERRHRGPLVVQRPFYPEPGGCCHVYLVHPPGGVVGGDQLELEVDALDGAHALITTPAATKLYRSNGAVSRLTQLLRVGSGATLEWLPQETIAFNGSRSTLTTRVELESGATFIGSEVLCLGRPAAGDPFQRGSLAQRLEVWREAGPLLIEQLRLRDGGPELTQRWGLAGCSTLGTLVAIAGSPTERSERHLSQLVERVRECLTPAACLAAVTQVSGAIVCRFLGDGAGAAHAVLRQAWKILRPELTQCPPVAPRIWAT